MSGRTVQPDGEKLRTLRVGRGWRVEDFARKAHCSPKSIVNAENGRNILLPTLAMIAGALGVEPKDLILGEKLQQPCNMFRLKLVIEADIEKLNGSTQLHSLIELLAKMLPATGEITIKDVKEGSVIVTLRMNEEDALRLVALFPDFQEHVREAIRNTPEGEAYFSGVDPDGQSADQIRRLLELGDAVRELRVSAGPDSGPNDTPGTTPQSPESTLEIIIGGRESKMEKAFDTSKGSSGKTYQQIEIRPRTRKNKSPRK